jgi:hypothetical protein
MLTMGIMYKDFNYRGPGIFAIIFFGAVMLTTGISQSCAVSAGQVKNTGNLQNTPPVRIIFDTDFHTDCDDAGALAVLHALADKGECEILAMMCSTLDPFSAPAVDVVNTYYGRPDIPIGIVKGAGVLRKSKYTRGIATEFPHDFKAGEDAPSAVDLYRDILEQQPDHSVVIVTVGYLTNIKNLLQLPAANGRASGVDLVRSKVSKWVCMGGNFIGNPPGDNLALGNVNFVMDSVSTYYAIRHWPGEIVFAGREVCSVPSGLSIGESLSATPVNNPVRRAYELYFDGKLKNRHVADLASVLYAVRGLRDYWDIQTKGYMNLHPDMTFEWQFDKDLDQAYLLKKQRDGKPNDRYVERVLDSLLVQAPRH